jgi:hypothetical protein
MIFQLPPTLVGGEKVNRILALAKSHILEAVIGSAKAGLWFDR